MYTVRVRTSSKHIEIPAMLLNNNTSRSHRQRRTEKRVYFIDGINIDTTALSIDKCLYTSTFILLLNVVKCDTCITSNYTYNKPF